MKTGHLFGYIAEERVTEKDFFFLVFQHMNAECLILPHFILFPLMYFHKLAIYNPEVCLTLSAWETFDFIPS